MAQLSEVKFIKGHGTGNDFLIIPDIDGVLELTAAQVLFLCDRNKGIGAKVDHELNIYPIWKSICRPHFRGDH